MQVVPLIGSLAPGLQNPVSAIVSWISPLILCYGVLVGIPLQAQLYRLSGRTSHTRLRVVAASCLTENQGASSLCYCMKLSSAAPFAREEQPSPPTNDLPSLLISDPSQEAAFSFAGRLLGEPGTIQMQPVLAPNLQPILPACRYREEVLGSGGAGVGKFSCRNGMRSVDAEGMEVFLQGARNG